MAQDEDAPWGDVLATMDALGIERATLVDNSFGGAVAQRVAAVAPERVVSLALLSSPVSSIERSPALKAMREAEEKALGEGDMETAVEVVAADVLVEALPNAQKTVLAGAGHLAPLEQPQAFRELLVTVFSDQD